MAKPTKTSLPVYDDFGNHVGIPPGNRTYERRQGCWNCVSFECGELFRRRVQDCHRRDVKAFLARGFGLHAAGAKANVTRQMLLDKAGIFGMCLKGKVPGDFVGCKHLCVDGWSGKVGVIGSLTPGQAFDEPVAALYDEHGQKITTDGDLVEPAPDAAAVERQKQALVAAQPIQTAPIVLSSRHPVVEEPPLQFVDLKVPTPIVAYVTPTKPEVIVVDAAPADVERFPPGHPVDTIMIGNVAPGETLEVIVEVEAPDVERETIKIIAADVGTVDDLFDDAHTEDDDDDRQ
jgi:hypothetical protein